MSTHVHDEHAPQSREVFRVHYTRESMNSSSGDSRLFESRLALEDFLLGAYLDMEVEDTRRSRGGTRRRWLMAYKWREFRREQGQQSETTRVTKIFGVHQFVGDGWVPVRYRIIEPEVRVMDAGDDLEGVTTDVRS